MVDATRALLDELMGSERNAPLAARDPAKADLHFSDPTVCKASLVCGTCPHQLFKNTKSDLGACGAVVHEGDLRYEALKAAWDALPPNQQDRYGYARDLLALLEDLVREMDRKVARAKDRLAREAAVERGRPLPPAEAARLEALKADARAAAAAADAAAEAGDVDAAAALTAKAEEVRARAEGLAAAAAAAAGRGGPLARLMVCETSGVLIPIEQRGVATDRSEVLREEHHRGKQYTGWQSIRAARSALAADLAGRPPPPREAMIPPRRPGGGGSVSGGGDDRGAGGDRWEDRGRAWQGGGAGERRWSPPRRRRSRSRERERERERDRDRRYGGGGGSWDDRDRRGGDRRRSRSRSPGRRRW